MTDRLLAYWFEFDLSPGDDCPRGTRIGAGVTAWDAEDATALLRSRIFTDGVMPPIRLAIENVDLRALDPSLVLENMLPPSDRGVWFPAVRTEPPRPGLAQRVSGLLRNRRAQPSR